jgi:hypothetical protein
MSCANMDYDVSMRRFVILVLLLVYPFQLALAMADRCCAMTPAGVSHHVLSAPDQAVAIDLAVVMAEDEGMGASDPHCAACSFSHTAAAPPGQDAIPFAHQGAASYLPSFPPFASLPAGRPERPKWPRPRA